MYDNVGLIGLGPMGRAIAQNLEDHGIKVKAWDHATETQDKIVRDLGPNVRASSVANMVDSLAAPRLILLFLPVGQPIDDTINTLRTCLKPGDIIADCGNSHYQDTERRQQELESSGISLIGVGVSGGPVGARSGPAIMAGGDPAAWKKIQPVFGAISAVSNDTPCCNYFGKGGAGHFVKMVHNGIEYGVMHLLAELHGYLEGGCGLDADAIAAIFIDLNQGHTAGYLTEITSQVANARLHPGDQPLIYAVDDAVDQKGTGGWTVKAALDYGASVPTIAEAVFARNLSSNRALRQGTENAPRSFDLNAVDQDQLSDALTLALASVFAQGLTLFNAIGDIFGYNLNQAEILRTWRQGCILRGEMLALLIDAVCNDPNSENILCAGTFPDLTKSKLPALRLLIANAISAGAPMAGFSSALAYLELLNGGAQPGGIIQLQRDYFGHHGLRDKKTGTLFHGPWNEAGTS